MKLSGARVELMLAGDAACRHGGAARLHAACAQAELPSAAVGVDGPTRARGRRRAENFLSHMSRK